MSGGSLVNMKLQYLPVCFLLFLSCWLTPEAFAEPSVTIGPASDSVYEVKGNDFSDSSGIDITIRYDPAALASPQVAQGGLVGGALMAVNVSTSGKIRLALVRVTAINGSGTIATITFTRVKSTGADIQSVVSSVISSSGRNIPVTSQVVNSVKTADSGVSTEQQTEQPTGGASSSPVPSTTVTTATAQVSGTPVATSTSPLSSTTVASATAPTVIVGVVVPSAGASASDIKSATSATDQTAPDTKQPEDEKTVAQEPAKVALAEKPVVQAPGPEKKKVMAYQSVLEKFKEYNGLKTPEALMALFSPQVGQSKQEPRIVLADGKTTVKVVLELDPKGENNNFLLDGVSLVSLNNKDKNFWIAELLPDKRAYEATISIPRNNQWYVIPLTIAPPMDVNIDRSANRLTDADFRLYLKNTGTAKAPRFDLNGDGVRNYIDDYIFTANYLTQRPATPTKPSSR